MSLVYMSGHVTAQNGSAQIIKITKLHSQDGSTHYTYILNLGIVNLQNQLGQSDAIQ